MLSMNYKLNNSFNLSSSNAVPITQILPIVSGVVSLISNSPGTRSKLCQFPSPSERIPFALSTVPTPASSNLSRIFVNSSTLYVLGVVIPQLVNTSSA